MPVMVYKKQNNIQISMYSHISKLYHSSYAMCSFKEVKDPASFRYSIVYNDFRIIEKKTFKNSWGIEINTSLPI